MDHCWCLRSSVYCACCWCDARWRVVFSKGVDHGPYRSRRQSLDTSTRPKGPCPKRQRSGVSQRGWILVAFREPRNMLRDDLSKEAIDPLYEQSKGAQDFMRSILTKQGGLPPLYLADQQWSPGYDPPTAPQYTCWVVEPERAHRFPTRKACEGEAKRWSAASYFRVSVAYTDESGTYLQPELANERARLHGRSE